MTRGRRLFLELGQVRELARVMLNGKPLGVVWTEPFRLEITKAAKVGRNVLKVEVTNLWVNRLIGDAQSDSGKKYTFTTIPTYRADAPWRASALGPVLDSAGGNRELTIPREIGGCPLEIGNGPTRASRSQRFTIQNIRVFVFYSHDHAAMIDMDLP